MQRPSDPDSRYEPLNARRRLLLLALAIATAVTVVLVMTDPPGGIDRSQRPPRPDVERCAPGQTTDCVGGTATVIVPAASAAR